MLASIKSAITTSSAVEKHSLKNAENPRILLIFYHWMSITQYIHDSYMGQLLEG